MTIYEQYDRERSVRKPDIESLGAAYLAEDAAFTPEQAAILAQIVVSYVDDTAARHRRYFDSPDSGSDAKWDIERELREAGDRMSFLSRLLHWLLGNGDSFRGKLDKYLDPDQRKELDELFDKNAKTEPVSVAEAQSLLRGYGLLERGNLAEGISNALESGSTTDGGDIPKCLKDALATGLLSEEEADAMKLIAFDLVAERAATEDEARAAAPLCALSAAKAAYDMVVSLKAEIRTTQLKLISAALKDSDEE